MSLIDHLEAILEWAMARRERRRSEVAWFLRETDSLCEGLVRSPDLSADETLLLHEKLKVLYDQASSVLGGQLREPDLGVVLKALASARMYYWVRVLDQLLGDRSGTPPGEAELDRYREDLLESLEMRLAAEERLRRGPGNDSHTAGSQKISPSFAALLKRGGSGLKEHWGSWLLEAKEACLQDLAQLQALRLSLKATPPRDG